jgi:hypothetical protein
MIVNMQEQQQREDTYGNEVKRRRITVEGAHLKVWKSLNQEGEEEEVTYIVQEPIQVQVPVQAPAQVPVQVPVPVHFIGRTVVIETTGRRIHRGKIGSLFELNGERAIHIETSDGQNLIFTASQMCDLKILHDPVPRRDVEVIVIEDDDHADEEVQQITQTMETIQILSDNEDNEDNDDCGSDATTECLEEEDNDDFPDVPFRPATARQDAVAEEEVAEEEVAEEEVAEEEEEPNNCCAVCFDATDAARNFVSLDCGHQFHFACIMGNMANGGYNRNQCPLCRSAVLQAYDVQNLDEVCQMRMDEMVENAASHNQRLQDELNLSRQHREDLTAEYMRVMSMNMQIGIRHAEEREAQDALERRAYICGLNERIAAIVANASNNDVRHNPSAAVHLERQMRELCMCFGMMAYDAQYDQDQDQDQDQDHQYQNQPPYDDEDADEDLMEVD